MASRSHKRSNVRRSNVTACLRCRSRKQRCDQNLPACLNCEVAGVDCVSLDINGRETPRSYVAELEDRIAQLEKQLQITRHTYQTQRKEAGQDVLCREVGQRQADTGQNAQGDADELAWSPLQRHISSSERNSIPFPLAAFGSISGEKLSESTEALLSQLPVETNVLMPSTTALSTLVNAYFEHSDFFSPILERGKFEELLDQVSKPHIDARLFAQCHFTMMTVFAVAVLLLKRKDASFPSSRSSLYYESAMKQLAAYPGLVQSPGLLCLENIALMIQYCLLSDRLTSAWFLIGNATRMAVELGLHYDHNKNSGGAGSTPASKGPTERGCWIFWSIYAFERILCQAMNRPFSLPEAVVTAVLPDPLPSDRLDRVAAVYLTKQRRLLSEMHETIIQNAGFDASAADFQRWRESMRERILVWRADAPILSDNIPHAPLEIFDGFVFNSMVLLYFPPNCDPLLSSSDVTLLADNASRAVELYRSTFTDGKLRYYWRTVYNLFRAGCALVYCIRRIKENHSLSTSLDDLNMLVNTCSSVLWGMVERHRCGRSYREQFDVIVANLYKSSSDPLENAFDGMEYVDFQESFGDFPGSGDMFVTMNDLRTEVEQPR